MRADYSKGIRTIDLVTCMVRKWKKILVSTLVIALAMCAILYVKQYNEVKNDTNNEDTKPELEEYRKNEIDKLADLYNEFWKEGYKDKTVSSADRLRAGYQAELIRGLLNADELAYYNERIGHPVTDEEPVPDEQSHNMSWTFKIILSLGFGFVISGILCALLCLVNPKLLSAGFFSDRYGIDSIPWDSSTEKGINIAEAIGATVENTDIKELFITGTVLDDQVGNLCSMIADALKPLGVGVKCGKSDEYRAEIIRNIKNAGMIVVVESIGSSNVKDIDKEMGFINDYSVETPIKAVLISNNK